MSISYSNPDQLLPSGEEGPESFIRVEADRLQQAAECLTATGDRVDPDHARRFIEYALEQTGGNISEAARRLGIARNTLKKRLSS